MHTSLYVYLELHLYAYIYVYLMYLYAGPYLHLYVYMYLHFTSTKMQCREDPCESSHGRFHLPRASYTMTYSLRKHWGRFELTRGGEKIVVKTSSRPLGRSSLRSSRSWIEHVSGVRRASLYLCAVALRTITATADQPHDEQLGMK